MSGVVILHSKEVHQCTQSLNVRCGVENYRTSDVMGLRKEDVCSKIQSFSQHNLSMKNRNQLIILELRRRNAKIYDGHYVDIFENLFELIEITFDFVNIIDPSGGLASSLGSVTSISQEIEQSIIWQCKLRIINGTLPCIWMVLGILG